MDFPSLFSFIFTDNVSWKWTTSCSDTYAYMCINTPTLIHPKGTTKKWHIQAFGRKVMNNYMSGMLITFVTNITIICYKAIGVTLRHKKPTKWDQQSWWVVRTNTFSGEEIFCLGPLCVTNRNPWRLVIKSNRCVVSFHRLDTSSLYEGKFNEFPSSEKRNYEYFFYRIE